MDLDDFIITVFCLIDEAIPAVLNGQRLRERGPAPRLYDSEVVTMEIVGAYLGLAQEQALFAYFRQHYAQHYAHFFPAVGYHKSHTLRERWRQYADRLQPFFLPAYAPQLNLIERLWRYLKDKLACHRWWNDLARLQAATEALLAGIEVHFHATDGPAFRPVQNFCESA